jgi:hypothetical protein
MTESTFVLVVGKCEYVAIIDIMQTMASYTIIEPRRGDRLRIIILAKL